MKSKPGRPRAAANVKEFFSSQSAKELWKGAKEKAEQGGGYAEFDDGKYRVRVVSASTGKSQNSGRFQHVFGFKFLDGEYKGQTKYQYQGLENETGMSILIQDLSKLGFEVDSLDDIEGIDKQVTKKQPVCDIRLKTNGEFQNVYVVKKAEDEGEEDADDTDTEEEVKTNGTAKGHAEDDVVEDDDTDTEEDGDDDAEEKPKPTVSKTQKSVPAEKDEEKDEEEEDDDDDSEEEEKKEPSEKVTLAPGMQLKIDYEDEEVSAKIVKIVEERKDGTGRIKVKLKNGEKVVVETSDIVDILE